MHEVGDPRPAGVLDDDAITQPELGLQRTLVGRNLLLGSHVELPIAADAIVRIRVDRLERPWCVLWTCVGGAPEWESSTLRLDLERLGSTTLLRLTHRCWRWRAASGALALSNFSQLRHLIRLRTLAPER
jgi:hypothetical protein